LRIDALSEVPDEWASLVRSWMRDHEDYRTRGAPDDNTRYLLYQMLAGSWPITEDRIQQYMLKAVREAKVHTSWVDADTRYEEALQDYISAVMREKAFREECIAFA